MRALYFEQHGGIENLRIGDRPEPEPGPGEVRVRLRTAALNHLDLFVLGGMPGIPIGLPHIGGADGVARLPAASLAGSGGAAPSLLLAFGVDYFRSSESLCFCLLGHGPLHLLGKINML